MADIELWRKRVSDWRGSGLTSVAFVQEKPFSAGGLRHWAFLLRQVEKAEEAARATKPGVRLGRVVRGAPPTAAEEGPRDGAPGAVVAAPAVIPEPVVVECGALRVAVRPGVDRKTLATVLELMAAQAGAR
jgi:hypothetical protein